MDDRKRLKSLFTNAPAELPEVTVVPAGKYSGERDTSGNDTGSAGSTSAVGPNRTSAPFTRAVPRTDHRGEYDATSRPVYSPPHRRALVAKVDYHNTMRRGSSNTTFTRPVGDASGSNDAVGGRLDPFEGWEEEKGLSFPQPAAAAAQRAVARTVNPRGETRQPRGVPGAQIRGPGVMTKSSSASSGSSPCRRRTPRPTRQRRGVSDERASPTIQQRMSSSRQSTENTHCDSAGNYGTDTDSDNGWMKGPEHQLSTSGFPKQLAVSGGLHDVAGASQSRRFIGVGVGGVRRRSGSRGRNAGIQGVEASEPKFKNNLHPAWKPKGLIRRQRAVAMIER